MIRRETSLSPRSLTHHQGGEAEGGDNDDDEDDDGFFVPHGYLSNDEGALEEEVFLKLLVPLCLALSI